MIDATSLLTGGGVTGFIVAIGYCLKLILDARREKAQDRTEGIKAQTYDANTVNAMTMEALRDERTRSERIQRRLDDLEEENDKLRNDLFEQKHFYEEKLFEVQRRARDLEIQVRDLTDKVSQLLREGGGQVDNA